MCDICNSSSPLSEMTTTAKLPAGSLRMTLRLPDNPNVCWARDLSLEKILSADKARLVETWRGVVYEGTLLPYIARKLPLTISYQQVWKGFIFQGMLDHDPIMYADETMDGDEISKDRLLEICQKAWRQRKTAYLYLDPKRIFTAQRLALAAVANHHQKKESTNADDVSDVDSLSSEQLKTIGVSPSLARQSRDLHVQLDMLLEGITGSPLPSSLKAQADASRLSYKASRRSRSHRSRSSAIPSVVSFQKTPLKSQGALDAAATRGQSTVVGAVSLPVLHAADAAAPPPEHVAVVPPDTLPATTAVLRRETSRVQAKTARLRGSPTAVPSLLWRLAPGVSVSVSPSP
jgi:hypothetical protein